MARFTIPDGWTVQAFQFALDCTAEQEACLRRQFGGRRYARNWAVRVLKEDITRHRETGEETQAPSLAGLRKRWNQVKDTWSTDGSPESKEFVDIVTNECRRADQLGYDTRTPLPRQRPPVARAGKAG